MLTGRTITKTPEASRSRTSRATAPSHAVRPDDVRATPAIREAILRVEGEYREMPGLSLTLPQAARLWGLDRRTCERVLATLIERRVLKRAVNGQYVRRRV
jgi:Fic family protein